MPLADLDVARTWYDMVGHGRPGGGFVIEDRTAWPAMLSLLLQH